MKPVKSQTKWASDCNVPQPDQLCWNNIYLRSFENSKSTTLRNFQFKFLHRIIPTNTLLMKYGIKDSDRCSFCKKERETLIHLFWECKVVQTFWTSFKYRLQSINVLKGTQAIDELDALGLKSDSKPCTYSFCNLVARYYIYKCKLKDNSPNIVDFLQQLKWYNSIEKEILSTTEMEKKWGPLKPLILPLG